MTVHSGFMSGKRYVASNTTLKLAVVQRRVATRITIVFSLILMWQLVGCSDGGNENRQPEQPQSQQVNSPSSQSPVSQDQQSDQSPPDQEIEVTEEPDDPQDQEIEPVTVEGLNIIRNDLASMSDGELLAEISAAIQRMDNTLASEGESGFTGVRLLSVRGSVVRQDAYGLRDQQLGDPLEVNTGFDMGSITKFFTALAIANLSSTNTITLDDQAGKWLPTLEGPPSEVTIDQLLSHEAGLAEYLGDDYELVDANEAIRRISMTPLLFEPGTDYAYSNAGYTLLALIIEAVSGTDYESYLRMNLLEPAGINSIGYVQAGWQQQDLAVGYIDGQPWGTPLSFPWFDDGPSWTLRGNGGLLTTASDLDRWFNALFAGEILDAPVVDRFLASYVENDIDTPVLNEAGGNDVFNALAIRWLSADLQLIMFSSESTRTAEQLTFTLLADDFIRLALAIDSAKARGITLPPL